MVKMSTSLLFAAFCLFGAIHANNLVLVGGGSLDHSGAIWSKFIDLAGGRGVAKVGIVTAASADPLDSYKYYHGLLTGTYGAAEASWIPVHLGNIAANSNQTLVADIARMTGFFFGGGDQARILTSFYETGRIESPVLKAIRQRYESGFVVGGTSAGTAAMGRPVMIDGGLSWDALRYGAFKAYSRNHPDDLVYVDDGGIGMIDDVILDSHFSQRGREGRLIRLLADTRQHVHGAIRGIGIDERTALVITNVGTPQARGEILGEHGVFIVDIGNAHVSTKSQYFHIRDVTVSYITLGDQVDMTSLNITFAPDKVPLDGHEYYDHAITSHKIFRGDRDNKSRRPEFLNVAANLFDSRNSTTTYGDTKEHPQFRVIMSRKSVNAKGYIMRSTSSVKDRVSYTNLNIEIVSHSDGSILIGK